MASVQKLLATSQVNLERDREYASRSIDLAIMSLADPAPDGEAGDAGGLAIAMLVKAPNLVALGTFVRYHAHIGFRRFSFFFDDIHDGADAPRCNDGAVAVLRELRDELVAEIVVHRCGRAWWKAAEARRIAPECLRRARPECLRLAPKSSPSPPSPPSSPLSRRPPASSASTRLPRKREDAWLARCLALFTNCSAVLMR